MEDVAGDLDLDNSSEKLFVFYESVSTLQDIASHTVALQLWNHFLNRAKCGKLQSESYVDFMRTVFNLDLDYETESKKLAELLKTPRCIENMLKKSLTNICNETKGWTNDFKSNIFSGKMSKYCPSNLDPNLIVWHQNSKIDGNSSASKMLIYGKLNAEQKFILMCAYGMAEELERFPMNSLSEFFHWLGIFDSKIAYWICKHRCDLHEIWLKMPEMISHGDTSINVIMANKHANRPFLDAFEYFWNRLSEDEQLSVAVEIPPEWWKLQKIILSTMSPFQQRQLVDRIPLELMTSFCIDCGMLDNVFIIWTRVKDRITEQQFVQFLNMVFRRAIRFPEVIFVNHNQAVYTEKLMNMLNNVWDTASDHLKRHIAGNDPDIILSSFMVCSKVPSPSIYRLVMKFLPLVNEQTRKQRIFLITESSVAWTQDIDFLNLCLPKEADQLQLKNQIMESDSMVRYCANRLYYLDFDDVINTVAFFSQNARDSGEFFKKLLESDELLPQTFILDYENWNKLSNFIDAVFTNYNLSTIELKKQLVSCLSADAVHCYNDEEGNLNALVKITEQVFSSEEMKTFKQTMLEHFQKMISSPDDWSCFRGVCYNTLVTWCSDDENQIIDFKSIVPIDAFFDEIFRTICSEGDINPKYRLRELDMYLMYFCSSYKEIQLLKIRKYYDRDRYWIGEVNRTWPNERIQNAISDWFCSILTELDFPDFFPY